MRMDRQLLKGATDTALLALIAAGPAHGYELARRLKARSEGVLVLGEGTLYPLLYKLEDKGLIAGKWELAENQRRRRVYRITPKGRRQLTQRTKQWNTLVHGMQHLLGGTAYG